MFNFSHKALESKLIDLDTVVTRAGVRDKCRYRCGAYGTKPEQEKL